MSANSTTATAIGERLNMLFVVSAQSWRAGIADRHVVATNRSFLTP